MQHLPLKMQNGNRNFHDMNLLQRNRPNEVVDRRPSISDIDMNKVFEEIDHDLGNVNFQRESNNRPRLNEKKTGPLILSPPVIKSFEEKPSVFKQSFEEESSEDASFEDESSDYIESSSEIYESSEQLYKEKTEVYEEESNEAQWFPDEYVSEEYDYESEELEKEYVVEDESCEADIGEYDLLPERQPDKAVTYKSNAGKKVKLPVHLANVDLEIDIFDTFHLSRPIGSITKVECSLHSIDAEVLLPTANLCSKGILIVDIEYVCPNEIGTMHSLKIQVPWKKIVPVQWTHCPELSWNSSKEYMFTSHDGHDPVFQREYRENLVEKVNFHLSSLHCVWNEQCINTERILIQGTAKMQIDLFQRQCLVL
jgi:hypothetical protein